MTIINQKGDNSQATGGDNSPIINNKNKISITTKQKTGWFFVGFILPILTGLIVNYLWNGGLCDLLK